MGLVQGGSGDLQARHNKHTQHRLELACKSMSTADGGMMALGWRGFTDCLVRHVAPMWRSERPMLLSELFRVQQRQRQMDEQTSTVAMHSAMMIASVVIVQA